MTMESLAVPWAAAPVTVAANPSMSHVETLPGYAGQLTAAVPETLATPWSGQLRSAPEGAAVASLDAMIL